jgi:PatG C-terminal
MDEAEMSGPADPTTGPQLEPADVTGEPPSESIGASAGAVPPALAEREPPGDDGGVLPASVEVAATTAGAASPAFVYALGRVEPRFPSLAVEQEFAQLVARANTQGLTDRQSLHAIVSERANRYLARQLCWVFLIEGLETYILGLRDPTDLDLLIEAVRAEPRRDDVDVVIGTRGPIAPPEACNGLTVPVVAVDQLYSFDRDSLIESIPRPDSIPQKGEAEFRAGAGEVFDRIMQMADNAGATDEHRALNYLAVRYSAIYATAAEAHARNASLSAVDVRLSPLSGARKIVDVIFSYTHRQTDVTEKYFVRVDMTEEFPFLITKQSTYYDR